MDTKSIDTLKISILHTMNLLSDIQQDISCDILDSLTAKMQVDILKKEILAKKKKLIEKVHIGKRGQLLSMGKFNESKKLYIVRCADNVKVYSSTEEGLIDAMLRHYGITFDSTSVKDVFERAITRYEKKHPEHSKTVYNYKLDYKAFIDSTFEKMDIQKITIDWLEDYTLDLIRNKNLKVSALRNYKTLLNLIFDKAIYEGLVRDNIAKHIKLRSLICYCDQSLAHRKPEDVLYSDQELEIIFADMWEKIEKGYAPYAYAVLLHAELGCRPDELICLKWSDINFAGKYISIERQQIEERNPEQSYRVVPYTKNERGVSRGGRLVPLSTKALDVLQKLKEHKNRLGIESEWLFSDTEGNLLKKKGYFCFNTALHKKYGMKVSGSYAFRRGLSARLEYAGIEPSERAAILGHSVETNLRFYTFAKPDYLERVRNALG